MMQTPLLSNILISIPPPPQCSLKINQEWIDTYIKQIQTLTMKGIPQDLEFFVKCLSRLLDYH